MLLLIYSSFLLPCADSAFLLPYAGCAFLLPCAGGGRVLPTELFFSALSFEGTILQIAL